MKQLMREQAPRGNPVWGNRGAGVETALFVSVQVLMLVCIVLVAAEFFTTA